MSREAHSKSDERKNRPIPPSKDRDLVITPAGPMPRDKVQQVGPGETVRRNPDGSHTIAPATEPPDPKHDRGRRRSASNDASARGF